jgi:hypothetical protein
VREQHPGEAVEVLRLAPVEPRELADGERRHRHGAARLDPRFRAAELLDEPLRVVRRLGVVPELGRSDHLGSVVEGDEAVLLGGDGHRDDRLRSRPAPGLHQRLPPRLRVLLTPGRERGGVAGAAGPDELAGVGVAHLDFRRLGGRIHPEDECHQPPASTRLRDRDSEARFGARIRNGVTSRGRFARYALFGSWLSGRRGAAR